MNESDERKEARVKKKNNITSPERAEVVEAMKNSIPVHTQNLHAFGCERHWTFLLCACACVCERGGRFFLRAHTHTGHQSAVNFRLSRGTATKSIIEVMNALLGTGISV